MGSTEARLYHDHTLVKEPGTSQETPWHQDQPYYNVDGRQNLSFWIPVDPVPKEACMRMVAGSHKGPWLMPRTFLLKQAKWFPEGSLQELPEYNADLEADPSSHDIRTWDLAPGDAIAFHMLSVHSAPGTQSHHGRRRVFSVRVLGDDVTHAPRSWVTSPPFPCLDETPAGAKLENMPEFPLLPTLPEA